MNQEELLTKTIGDKEIAKLQAKNVIVKGANFEEMGQKKNVILKLSVKHPYKDDLIIISKVSLLVDKTIKTLGLWYNTDADDNIQKGSGIALFMEFYKIKTLVELKDIELVTELDDKGYLVAKAY